MRKVLLLNCQSTELKKILNKTQKTMNRIFNEELETPIRVFLYCSQESPYLFYENDGDGRFIDTQPYQTSDIKNHYLEEDDEYLNCKVIAKFTLRKVEKEVGRKVDFAHPLSNDGEIILSNVLYVDGLEILDEPMSLSDFEDANELLNKGYCFTKLKNEKDEHPLQALADLYDKSLKKEDSKGFAEIFKKATKVLFKRIKKELGCELHFKDVSYGNGYFIFAHGTNSVVSFHIEEIPEWLGGIWWRPLETKDSTEENPKYRTDAIGCSLFFQYEAEIDKFKPSASMFGGSEFEFHFKEGYGDSNFYDSVWDLKFIKEEPYLAYYKEMFYTDFNHEYVSRAKAKAFYIKEHELRKKQAEVKKQNEETMLETLKYILGPVIKEGYAFVVKNKYLSPCYDIFFKNFNLDDGKPLYEKEGHYYLFEGYEDAKKDEKLWKQKEKECEKRSKKVESFFWNECSTCLNVRNEENFNRILKGAIKDKTIVFYQGNYKEETE